MIVASLRRCIVASFSSAAGIDRQCRLVPGSDLDFLVVFGAQAAQAVLAQVGSVKEIAAAADRVL